MRCGSTGLLIALALALAACPGGPPAGPSGPGPAPKGKRQQRRPGVNEWFLPAKGKSPVDLAGSAAADLVFTEFRRGRFRVWHARGIPGARADAVWRAVRGKGSDLIVLLGRDEVFNEGYHAQFINDGGAVQREGTLSLQQALVIREKQLGERAARMRAALASATPNESFRHSMATAEHLFDQRWVDPELEPYDLALTVYRGPIEDAARFLVAGAGLEPQPAELAAALRHWRDKYGVAPLRWERGYALELAVERPPRTLAERRAVAWQFFLMCPAQPGGLMRGNEPPDELLVRVEQRRWDCAWFVQ